MTALKHVVIFVVRVYSQPLPIVIEYTNGSSRRSIFLLPEYIHFNARITKKVTIIWTEKYKIMTWKRHFAGNISWIFPAHLKNAVNITRCLYMCACIIFNTYIIKLYYTIISLFLYLPLSLRWYFANGTALSWHFFYVLWRSSFYA